MSNKGLAQKYEVTQKVALAQQQYIKDLEAKLQAGSDINGGLSATASATQIQQLQRGIHHFRTVADTNQQVNQRLQRELNQARAELGTLGAAQQDAESSISSSDPNKQKQQMRVLARKMKQQHARELEATRSDLVQLEAVVERNQKLATSAHRVLEEERKHRERLVEEQVSQRVRSVLSSSDSDGKVEVSFLKAEVERLRSELVERDDGAHGLRGELMTDVGRLRQQLSRQRTSHGNHVSKLQDQLVQTVRVMEEREIIIAEERQAYESELKLAMVLSDKREDVLRSQVNDLNQHSEALTTTLARQPLLYTDDDGVLMPEDEKTTKEIEEEYEVRLRGVLKLKEKSEAKMLAERSSLLQSLQEEEMTRSERERLCVADLKKRIETKDSMLSLWEEREKSLEREMEAVKQQLDDVLMLAEKREETFKFQLQASSSQLNSGGAASDKSRSLDELNRTEASSLTRHVKELQSTLEKYQSTYRDSSMTVIGEQTLELQRVVDLAEVQVASATRLSGGAAAVGEDDDEVFLTQTEYHALVEENKVLRANALSRDTSLSIVVERQLTTESELRNTVRESVDALETAQEQNQRMQEEHATSLRELREYVQKADEVHTKTEEMSAMELTRMRNEVVQLHATMKRQRKQYEEVILRQEKSMRENVSVVVVGLLYVLLYIFFICCCIFFIILIFPDNNHIFFLTFSSNTGRGTSSRGKSSSDNYFRGTKSIHCTQECNRV